MKFIQPMAVTAVFFLTASPAFPQGAGVEWDTLNSEALSLYQNGQYDRAVVVAEKALEVAEKAVGPDHPDVATSLNNLAILYKTQGKYAEAEALYNRSLAIYEKAFGPDRPGVATHPHVATTLRNLAELYRETKREYEADELEKRAARRGIDPQTKPRGRIDRDLFLEASEAVSRMASRQPRELTGAQQELHLGDLDPKITSASFRENWGLILIFSAILTWGIGLTPPLLVRFAFMGKPMSKYGAICFVVFLYFVNLMIFIALGSEESQQTYRALVFVAMASYYILRRGAKKGKANDSPPLVPREGKSNRISEEDKNMVPGSFEFEKGKALYLEKQDQEALTWLDKAIECGLCCRDAYDLRGDCLDRCGLHDDAINDFNKAISLEPEDCHVYFKRANSKSDTGDFDGALQDLQEAIRLSELDNELNRSYRASAQEMGWDSHTIMYATSIPMVQMQKRVAERPSLLPPNAPPSSSAPRGRGRV